MVPEVERRLIGKEKIPEIEEGLAEKLGIFDPNVADVEVADRVQHIVRTTFSQVNVTSSVYDFQRDFVDHSGDSSSKLNSRIITVSLNDWESFCWLIRSIWTEAGPMLNSNRAARAILGSVEEKDLMELRNAAQRRCDVSVAISYDHTKIKAWPVKPYIPSCPRPIQRCTIQ